MSSNTDDIAVTDPILIMIKEDLPHLLIDMPMEYGAVAEVKELQLITLGDRGLPGVKGDKGDPGNGGVTLDSYPAGNTITAHRGVVLQAGSVWAYDPTNPLHPDLFLGISLNAATTGGSVTVQRSGTITDASLSFTPGVVILAGSGLLRQVRIEGEPLLVVGFSPATDSLVLSIRTPIFS